MKGVRGSGLTVPGLALFYQITSIIIFQGYIKPEKLKTAGPGLGDFARESRLKPVLLQVLIA